MIIGIQASRNFDDYQVFLRAMGTALAMMQEGDKVFTIYSAGPVNLNSMASEFFKHLRAWPKSQGYQDKVKKSSCFIN